MIDRNESLRDKIATIVQAGYSQRKTSVETADEIKSKISFLSILTRLERENAELRSDNARLEAARLEHQLKHGPCFECGATSADDTDPKHRCHCAGDKDHCHGCDLWP